MYEIKFVWGRQFFCDLWTWPDEVMKKSIQIVYIFLTNKWRLYVK